MVCESTLNRHPLRRRFTLSNMHMRVCFFAVVLVHRRPQYFTPTSQIRKLVVENKQQQADPPQAEENKSPSPSDIAPIATPPSPPTDPTHTALSPKPNPTLEGSVTTTTPPPASLERQAAEDACVKEIEEAEARLFAAWEAALARFHEEKARAEARFERKVDAL